MLGILQDWISGLTKGKNEKTQQIQKRYLIIEVPFLYSQFLMKLFSISHFKE
jgi:hypothetical protein